MGSIILSQNEIEFTLEDGSTHQSIMGGISYLNYNEGILTVSPAVPSSNVLFSYTSKDSVDVYDFKNNIIIFGGLSDTIFGLFHSGNDKVTIKNLNIKVESNYTAIEGYLLTDESLADSIENCHIIFELPGLPPMEPEKVKPSAMTDAKPLLGNSFTGSKAVVKKCSSTYLGTNIPTYFTGGICGSSCGIDGNVTINNCYSTGAISGGETGGICGNACGKNGNVTINNCYSTGAISGDETGGICGNECGDNGNVTINNCYSTGAISGSGAGGICGDVCGINGGNVTINNCYSTGDIILVIMAPIARIAAPTASLGGGICGSSCGNNGNVNINNCYSTGAIGEKAGGICGNECGFDGGTVTINSCYSTGAISGDETGGICGADAGAGGNVTINNCYSTGAISGSGAGGICGVNVGIDSGTVTITCSYTLNGISPVDDIAQGTFVGGIDMSANFTETNNSYLTLTPPVGPLVLGVTLSVLLSNCASAYTNKRCVFGGEAPMLYVFENNNIWTTDDSCLESFKPQLQAFFNCDVWKINTNTDIFAPKLGFCGCSVDGVWPKTLPGKTVTLDCIDNEKKSRQCDNKGVWESVITESCGGVGLNAKQKATIGITVTIVGVFLLLILLSFL